MATIAEDTETVGSFLQSRNDLSEVYSPPRVTKDGASLGLKCAFAFGVIVLDKDGYVWDFSERSCRKRAWQRLRAECPYMLIGSPPCTAFSIIQSLNARTPEGKARVESAKKQASIHL